MSMPKLSAEVANNALSRLDKVASAIQANYESWGIPFETAKGMVNDLDKTADEIEVSSFGKESFIQRQAEVIKQDADEKYMSTYAVNPLSVQIESDEPYMKLYGLQALPGQKTDQSSAVQHGVSTSGRPLTPHR